MVLFIGSESEPPAFLHGRGADNGQVMSRKKSAELAEAAELYGDRDGTAEQREHKANMLIADTSFKLLPEYSNNHLSVFVSGDGRSVHIAFKGRNIGASAQLRDMIQDARQESGKDTGEFRLRRNLAEKAVRDLNPTSLSMSGHNYGGTALIEALIFSPYLAMKTQQADTFGTVATPFQGDEAPNLMQKKQKERLNQILTNYRMDGDLASKGLIYSNTPGQVVTYPLENTVGEEWIDANEIAGEPETGREAPLTKEVLSRMGTEARTVYANHIDHFAERKLSAPELSGSMNTGMQGETEAAEAAEEVGDAEGEEAAEEGDGDADEGEAEEEEEGDEEEGDEEDQTGSGAKMRAWSISYFFSSQDQLMAVVIRPTKQNATLTLPSKEITALEMLDRESAKLIDAYMMVYALRHGNSEARLVVNLPEDLDTTGLESTILQYYAEND